MAGDGVRNPADLTPVLDELGDIDDQLDDIRLEASRVGRRSQVCTWL